MNIRTGCGILLCMDISALNTTNDIEKLRAMALAMVQKVMSENAEKERELLEKSRRIQLLEEMLKLVRQQRFGKNANRWPGCSVPCSKRTWTRISQKSQQIWTNCFLRPGTKTEQQHVLFVSPCLHIFPVLKRLSRQLRNVVLTVMPPALHSR